MLFQVAQEEVREKLLNSLPTGCNPQANMVVVQGEEKARIREKLEETRKRGKRKQLNVVEKREEKQEENKVN